MREIKALGPEVFSKFVVLEVVGTHIDRPPLCLWSRREPRESSETAALLSCFEGGKVGEIPRAWVNLCFNLTFFNFQ